MNDREILELAAKAAGIECHIDHLDGTPKLVANDYGAVWNPLVSDAHAFQLAVKLRMCVSVEHDAQATYWAGDSLEAFNESLGNDECLAMRRAIVRAAAEIGRTMP
ncbi:hypothetical protein QK393_25780 [Pseudomonas aeruginosa]|nr:hypothetical protein [Pseudomonas aeruginosa]